MRTMALISLAAVVGLAGSTLAGPMSKHQTRTRTIPQLLRAPDRGPSNQLDGPGVNENFDSYANGSGIVGQGGWLFWAASGSMDATVDNTLAASAPNSLVSVLETDVVQVVEITSGKWQAKVKTYTPSTGTGLGYFIMLNTYSNPYVAGGNWSIEVHFNRTTNQVISQNRSVANGGPGPTTLPLITDQWVELVLDIDLDADTFTMTYGGQPLVTTNGKWSWNASAAQGAVRIQCIDLYSQMAGFRWDDLSLLPVTTCFADCDGSTTLNVNDFVCFQSAFAAVNLPLADCDSNQVLNVLDFVCFQSAFAAGCP